MTDDGVVVTDDLPATCDPDVVVRFFPEYSAEHPLWLSTGFADLDALRLPHELASRLRRWADYWDRTHHWDDGWPADAPAQWWVEEEERLPGDVALAFGTDFVVRAEDRFLHSTAPAGSPDSATALHAVLRLEAEERARIAADVARGARYTVTSGDDAYTGSSPD